MNEKPEAQPTLLSGVTPPSRDSRVKRAATDLFDVAVIGGGIHGACVAKLTAKAGLSTALFERDDYASATSSRSSKMAHGGLRYLEMFDFEQVFEGIKAREQLFERCPNLVRPEKFLIPVPRGDLWFRLKLGIGLFLYDLMVRNSAHKHRWIARRDLRFASFHQERADLAGCFEYTDGLMNDSRLALELVVSAQSYGCCALNYAGVEAIERSRDSSLRLTWRDHLGNATHETRARCVINCAGPWAPRIQAPGSNTSMPEVRYSRGAHLVFSVPWRDPSLFLPLSEKGRYYFVWPHAAGTLVGTTERVVTELERDPQPSHDEVEEILERLAKDLPNANLNRSTLQYAFAGVRTLPLRGSATHASRLSRKHIWHESDGVFTLLGGKYTTFAWTASEGFRAAYRHLTTRSGAAPDALDDLPSALQQDEAATLERELAETYGRIGPGVKRAVSRLGRMCLLYASRDDAWREIAPGVLHLELLHAIEVEQAETIEDVVRRRLDLESAPRHGMDALHEITRALVATHSPAEIERQAREWNTRIATLRNLLQLPPL